MPEFFEPDIETVSFVPSEKEKMRKQIQKAISRKKGKRKPVQLPKGEAKNLIGFYNVKRHEPSGVYKDSKTGETYLTGDSVPVQVVGAVRSKRSGVWKHGKKR